MQQQQQQQMLYQQPQLIKPPTQLIHEQSEKTSIDVNQNKYPVPLPKSKHKKKRINVHGRDWNDGFTNQHIPDYKVYEDKYCQGYIGILKKKKRYNQYMHAILKPGGIRPQRRNPFDGGHQQSMYSDGSPGKSKQRSGSQSGSQVVMNRGLQNVVQSIPNQQVSRPQRLRVAVSQNRGQVVQNQDQEINEDAQNFFQAQLQSLWNRYQIPNWHRIKFIESLQSQNPKIVVPIVQKEIEDFTKEQSLVQRVEIAIRAREECIKQIELLSQQDFAGIIQTNDINAQNAQELIEQIAAQLQNLRLLSIHVVERIGKWRDQLRYLALLSNTNKVSKHKLKQNIPQPYLTKDNLNYLIKMRNDTSHFQQLPIARYFNFREGVSSDPFLFACSLQQRNQLAAGSGISAIKKGKMRNEEKHILPLPENILNRARECEELITMERGELRNAISSQNVRLVQMVNSDKKAKNASQTEEKENNGGISLNNHNPDYQIPSDKNRVLSNNQKTQSNNTLSNPILSDHQNQRTLQHDQVAKKIQFNNEQQYQSLDQKSQNDEPSLQSLRTLQQKKEEQTPIKQQPQIQAQEQKVQETPRSQRIVVQENSKPYQLPQSDESEEEVIEQPKEIEMVLKPLGLHERDFPSFLQNYLLQIDSRLQQSFYDYELLLQKQSNGYERHYIKLTSQDSDDVIGLAMFNVDYTAQNEFRGFIRHLSTKDFSLLEKATQQVMDFIWKNVDCNNVRIEIYHMKDEATGKFQADPDVKNPFTKCGFKWKTLSNDPNTGKRAQVMQTNRTANVSSFDANLRNIKSGLEPLTVKASALMVLEKREEDDDDYDGDFQEQSDVCLISCTIGALKHYKEDKKLENKYSDSNPRIKDEGLSKLVSLADSLPKESQFPAQRSIVSDNLDEIQNILKSQGINVDSCMKGNTYLTSILSLVCRFPPFDLITHNGYYYQRIKSDQIMRVSYKNKSTNKQQGQDLVIIPTDDEKLKVIIIPKSIISEGAENLSLEVQNILKNCEISQLKAEEVLIPSFKLEVKQEYQEIVKFNVDSDYQVKSCHNVIQIETSKGKYQNEGLKFDINPIKQYLIDSPFIFALSDAEMEEQIDNLPLLIASVGVNNWIKQK